MSNDQVIDAEVVEESTALVVQPRRSEVLRPLAVADQKAAMNLYQDGLRQILDKTDWQDAGRGEKFVKRSGWRKIAAWFDLSIEMVRDHVERAPDGQVVRAQVWARAVAPSGRFADGDGYCDVAEKRFERDGGRQKLENDLRGTATTRAVNRAISNLVGMGAVSAEEMDDTGSSGSRMGEEIEDPGFRKAVAQACVKLSGDSDLAMGMFKAVSAQCGGYMPWAAGVALLIASGSEIPVPDVKG